eukprot:CAMPEP_0117422256 /NCGR_PEP_ID=MMETSP0758-20121206/3135_1 /TAXON_ID=63605 /ORGANISM="Percolomonas cosmopolitus, Strain AE-1 (ATCC 50343)" /LENGTH=264 /DNA_ID=CAMNT_0005204773 /DNA_START=1822 /DNA_END=2613 /DNA_ORIENTATION=+
MNYGTKQENEIQFLAASIISDALVFPITLIFTFLFVKTKYYSMPKLLGKQFQNVFSSVATVTPTKKLSTTSFSTLKKKLSITKSPGKRIEELKRSETYLIGLNNKMKNVELINSDLLMDDSTDVINEESLPNQITEIETDSDKEADSDFEDQKSFEPPKRSNSIFKSMGSMFSALHRKLSRSNSSASQNDPWAEINEETVEQFQFDTEGSHDDSDPFKLIRKGSQLRDQLTDKQIELMEYLEQNEELEKELYKPGEEETFLEIW